MSDQDIFDEHSAIAKKEYPKYNDNELNGDEELGSQTDPFDISCRSEDLDDSDADHVTPSENDHVAQYDTDHVTPSIIDQVISNNDDVIPSDTERVIPSDTYHMNTSKTDLVVPSETADTDHMYASKTDLVVPSDTADTDHMYASKTALLVPSETADTDHMYASKTDLLVPSDTADTDHMYASKTKHEIPLDSHNEHVIPSDSHTEEDVIAFNAGHLCPDTDNLTKSVNDLPCDNDQPNSENDLPDDEEPLTRKPLPATSSYATSIMNYAAKKFNEWINQGKKTCDLARIDPNDLNELLTCFYAEVLGAGNRRLSPNTLSSIRRSLQKIVSSPPLNRTFDIISDKAFKEANKVLKARIKHLRLENHILRPDPVNPMTTADMMHLATYFSEWPSDPVILMEATWFYLSQSFHIYSTADWRMMIKDAFKLEMDDQGCFSLIQRLPFQNNIKMYGIAVDIYLFYVSKISTFNKLLQLPVNRAVAGKGHDWYRPAGLGDKRLSKMLKSVCHKAKLSRVYTRKDLAASDLTLLSEILVAYQQAKGDESQLLKAQKNMISSSPKKPGVIEIMPVHTSPGSKENTSSLHQITQYPCVTTTAPSSIPRKGKEVKSSKRPPLTSCALPSQRSNTMDDTKQWSNTMDDTKQWSNTMDDTKQWSNTMDDTKQWSNTMDDTKQWSRPMHTKQSSTEDDDSSVNKSPTVLSKLCEKDTKPIGVADNAAKEQSPVYSGNEGECSGESDMQQAAPIIMPPRYHRPVGSSLLAPPNIWGPGYHRGLPLGLCRSSCEPLGPSNPFKRAYIAVCKPASSNMPTRLKTVNVTVANQQPASQQPPLIAKTYMIIKSSSTVKSSNDDSKDRAQGSVDSVLKNALSMPNALQPVGRLQSEQVSGKRKRPLTGQIEADQDDHIKVMSGSSSLRALVRSFIPALSHDLHKGQCGRIGIIGGCKEYTGAPYFAAISALKVGADLSHVFCNSAAAPVIKSYSPDLIVHPILDSGAECLVEMKKWMPRLHVLVIGPGLGRETSILNTVKGIMKEATKRDLPMVIDADGLFLVTQDPETVRNNRNVILTPNIMEFSRLYNAVLGLSAPCDVKPDDVRELSKQLGNVTIVSKGKTDIITNGSSCIECCESGSLRRCGGQGDLLSGAMGTFVHWACWAQKGGRGSSEFSSQGPMMSAAYAACELTRQCSARAFTTVGRSMNTTDMITQIQHAYYQLYEA